MYRLYGLQLIGKDNSGTGKKYRWKWLGHEVLISTTHKVSITSGCGGQRTRREYIVIYGKATEIQADRDYMALITSSAYRVSVEHNSW